MLPVTNNTVSDLTTIILTFNEELHIERCIRSIKPVTNRIIIVDSFSTDNTLNIASSLGVEVVKHHFFNYATQFNWALDNLTLNSEWVMRFDADEYMEIELQNELQHILANIDESINGIYFKRKVFFNSKWIRYGGIYPQTLLRIWRTGLGHCEQRWADEHIVLSPGSSTIITKGHIIDDNHKGITFWIEKHNKYASREAVDLLNLKYALFIKDDTLFANADRQAKYKRWIKEKIYARLPLGTRAFLYFIYRYFLRLGFLDGSKGFTWHFLQGYWYRMLVDLKIRELEERSGGDIEKLKQLLRDQHGLNI